MLLLAQKIRAQGGKGDENPFGAVTESVHLASWWQPRFHLDCLRCMISLTLSEYVEFLESVHHTSITLQFHKSIRPDVHPSTHPLIYTRHSIHTHVHKYRCIHKHHYLCKEGSGLNEGFLYLLIFFCAAKQIDLNPGMRDSLC